MRAQIEAVVDELKRRKAEGESAVYVSEDALALLTAQCAVQASGKEDVGNEQKEVVAEKVTEVTEQRPRKQSVATGNSSTISPQPSGFQVAAIPEPPVVELPEGDKRTQWEWLRERVVECPVCNQHARIAEGKQVVFGVGNIDAEIFFCGEAPGAEEEDQGEPFVGKAGQLLTKIIQAMGLQREDVYIGNILNWRPEKENMEVGNRPPTAEEMAFCLPYLKAQVQVVQPKLIVALGMTAVNGLLGPDPQRRMGKIRGTWLDFEGIPLIPTYHPSYLLRYATPEKKRQVWEDMLEVMEKVGLPISEKQRGFFR